MRTFICLQPIPTFSAPHLDFDFSPLILNPRLRYIKLFVFLKTNKILQVIISVYLYFYVRSKRAGRNINWGLVRDPMGVGDVGKYGLYVCMFL